MKIKKKTCDYQFMCQSLIHKKNKKNKKIKVVCVARAGRVLCFCVIVC